MKRVHAVFAGVAGVLSLLCVLSMAAHAADWPAKPVRVVVAYSAGCSPSS